VERLINVSPTLPTAPTDADFSCMRLDDTGIDDRVFDMYALGTSPAQLAYPEHVWVYRGLDEMVCEERVYIWPDGNDPRDEEVFGGGSSSASYSALGGWGYGTYGEDSGDMNVTDWGDGGDDFDGASWEDYFS